MSTIFETPLIPIDDRRIGRDAGRPARRPVVVVGLGRPACVPQSISHSTVTQSSFSRRKRQGELRFPSDLLRQAVARNFDRLVVATRWSRKASSSNT